MLGQVDTETGRYSQGIEELEKALEIFKDIGALPGEMKILEALSKLHYRNGAKKIAASQYEQALAISNLISMPLHLKLTL